MPHSNRFRLTGRLKRMLKKFLKAAKVIQKKHLQQFFTKETA